MNDSDVAAGAERKADMPALPAKAYSIDEFCQTYRLSKATLFREWKRGRGPRIMKVGRRTLITLAAADEWERRMEGQAA